jgi:hypothetical protein
MAEQEQTRQASPGATKEQAGELWREAKETARSAADSRQHVAAQDLGDFAGALRQAARSAKGDGTTVSRVADNLAGGLERLSSRLQSRDFNSLVRDVEDFARQQPLVFIGAAVLTGFVATRFLKSSAPSRAEPAMTETTSAPSTSI